MNGNKAASQWIVALLFFSLFTSCTRIVTTAPAVTPAPRVQNIHINHLRVSQDNGIYILGETNLTDGSCIQTELLAGGEPVTWWPKNVCIQAEAGKWEILVPLGRRGAPARLSPDTRYEIHAWWPEDASRVSLNFPLVIK